MLAMPIKPRLNYHVSVLGLVPSLGWRAAAVVDPLATCTTNSDSNHRISLSSYAFITAFTSHQNSTTVGKWREPHC